jgi:hypothetical protein
VQLMVGRKVEQLYPNGSWAPIVCCSRFGTPDGCPLFAA